MNKAKITDIFFDLDHTLWDFDRNSMLAFQRVFLKHNINLDLTGFIKAYEPINFAYWKLFREERVTKEELRRGRLIEAFTHFKMEFPLDEIDLLAESYIDELPIDNHLFEGTIEVLEYLSEKYILHIITNGFHEVQNLKLRNSGISNYFKTITTSEEVGLKKPNPVIFKKAMEKASVTPKQSLMIGDTFEADILGAEAVGMHTLFYNYRNDEVPSKYRVVYNLPDIKKHL
ncbi:putative hydrolase of the HAD superfamily [Ulvibacter sp. MAR_2010_11]|uniref:YjjG family noncanonical pyrimidine nucleotidase n=1 Tax=Ulvibacter sp. MAR_2010_11 TaxID=1250229 RepID=UPI000C2B5F34|nr:YjjG family noncanonical pyrimidine nucleotidase [Ulvibacter sp. MAR_2010_11]PKA83455.1 putative hydrolase of the HAD superfamily [Ulvibacter sp. MAR_2010_11]